MAQRAAAWPGQIIYIYISWLPALAPALAAKIHAACRRYFLKGFCCRWLGCGEGNKFFGVKLLSRNIAGRIVLSHIHAFTLRRIRNLLKIWQCDELSVRRSMNFLADGPASCSVARSNHIYVSWLPALAPVLAAKIHATGCGKCDPPEDQSPYLLQVAS